MKLLIVTQVVDDTHPILGFFCKWIEAFSCEIESIEVVCLEEGNHNLPNNVTVHSLGKEKKVERRIVYIWRYLILSWKLRKKYDAVFTHMNPEYIIAGYPIWVATGKEIGMWYAHGAVSARLHVATFMSKYVFTSTEGGFRVDTPKRKIVGQGINTTLFSPSDSKIKQGTLRLITVGRMTPVKNVDALIRCCSLLKKEGISFIFSIVGGAVTDSEKTYEKQMIDLVHELDLDDDVVFVGSVPQKNLPGLLQQSDIFIHDGQTGSLDKVLLEAMSSGIPVFSSNESYKAILKDSEYNSVYSAGDFKTLAKLVKTFITLPPEEKQDIITDNQIFVTSNHSLATFAKKIVSEYRNQK